MIGLRAASCAMIGLRAASCDPIARVTRKSAPVLEACELMETDRYF